MKVRITNHRVSFQDPHGEPGVEVHLDEGAEVDLPDEVAGVLLKDGACAPLSQAPDRSGESEE